MAAIDKIYVDNYDQYLQFKEWCEQQPPLLDKYGNKVPITTYLYDWDKPFEGSAPVFNAPCYVDAYVIRNCPFDFIHKELMINYGHWSQERIKEYYEEIKNWKDGKCPYWAKLEDFITLEDGTMMIKGLKKSNYSKIKDNELYTSPKVPIDYVPGTHFRCIQYPNHKYNFPFRCKRYFVEVSLPLNMDNLHMWYHNNTKTWDFSDDFVKSEWSSSCAYIRTIKGLKRYVKKWKLPVGTTLTLTGRYIFDTYKFIITK